MTRDQAYDVAVRSFHHEHDRWIQDAVVLFGVLVSILFAQSRIPGLLVLLVETVISVVTLCISLTIRGSTDAWRNTLRQIEYSPADVELLPFELFDQRLGRYTSGGGQ
jgi:hypothetical protein